MPPSTWSEDKTHAVGMAVWFAIAVVLTFVGQPWFSGLCSAWALRKAARLFSV